MRQPMVVSGNSVIMPPRPPKPPAPAPPKHDDSSPSLGYKIMTVFMVIVCALNVGAFIISLVMFAAAYRLVKNGKSYDKIDTELDALQHNVTTNMSSVVSHTLMVPGGEFLLGTANSVIYRIGGPQDQFKPADLLSCHQTARREAQLAVES